MAVAEKYQKDVDAILSHRYDLGADLWTTPDKRLFKGGPFSAVEAPLYLAELGMDPQEPVLRDTCSLFLDAWQLDGRFKVYPNGGILPCHTTNTVDFLCRMGYAENEKVQKSLEYLLDTQYQDGGWRCNKFSFGRGPETEYSNPLPALCVLAACSFTQYLNNESRLDKAVEFLLHHWEIKMPIGPCHYGIGTLFMQVEYPFRGYNLFYYVYVLSFYDKAKKDPRFLEALAALQSRLVDGQVVVERVVPKLAKLEFCKKGQPSELATKRYQQILQNLMV